MPKLLLSTEITRRR